MSRLQSIRDSFNAFVAAGFVIVAIVSIGSPWPALALAAALAGLGLLGMYLRSWMISAMLTGIVLSLPFGAINGSDEKAVANAIIGAIAGLVFGRILTLATREPPTG